MARPHWRQFVARRHFVASVDETLLCYCAVQYSKTYIILPIFTITFTSLNATVPTILLAFRIVYDRGVYPKGGWESNLPRFLKWGVEGLVNSNNKRRE